MRRLKLKDVGNRVLLRNNEIWKIIEMKKIPNSPPWMRYERPRKNWFRICLEKDEMQKWVSVSKCGKIHHEDKTDDFDFIQIYSSSSFNFVEKCFQN